ncbi:hypothetical protein [Gymnodinialimonas hymeniacidonis]|uniref:hypothetical protein n=1 Tax=Gymnodinialimonas hymeniacidonis TaxID=3126508 RepID=UPI0034C668AF
MSEERQRLLLICPLLFGYHQAISDAAQCKGFDVDWVNARASERTAYKVLMKGVPSLLRKLTQTRMVRMLHGVRDLENIDRIVIVKGDGLTEKTLTTLRKLAPCATVHFYMWDSVRNHPGSVGLARLCDTVATFDARDAARLGWQHLPLFSFMPLSASAGASRTGNIVYDWSFVGSVHGDRYAFLSRLWSTHKSLKPFVHCYIPSRLVWLLRALRDPQLFRPGEVPISHEVLSKEAYLDVLNASRAVVDIEHARQTGLTMRSIETLLAGKKLITTNPHVRDVALYDASRVAVIDRDKPRIPDGFLDIPFAPVPEGLRRQFHVSGWLDAVLRGK